MRELDKGTEHLLAKVENGVGYLIMNRPDARNAMSAEMNEAMQKNIADFELNNEVRCIVLTGAGNAFCAGGDVKGMSSRNSEGRRDITIDKAIPPLYGALVKNEQDVQLLERLAFMTRREGNS